MAGIPLDLQLHRVWWSSKVGSVPVTMFTTATMDRLDMLETQCLTYPGGPHAAAVYLPIVQGPDSQNLTFESQQALRTAEARLQDLFYRMEASQRACHMRLLLLYELSGDSALAYLTPINALRNAALLAAQTPLVMMIDVDLGVSATLVEFLSQAKVAEQLVATSNDTFWVLPAWDVDRGVAQAEVDRTAEAALAGSKLDLIKAFARGRLNWFGQYYFQLGHSPTNYTRWITARRTYRIEYSVGYEPWGILSRTRMGLMPYDARFRGCFHDKITQVITLHHSGVVFRALPNAWVVHRPHALNPAAAIAKAAAAGASTSEHGVGALKEVVEAQGRNATKFEHHKEWSHVLKDQSIVQMLANVYRPTPGRQFAYCRSVLPWWSKI